MYKIEFSSDEFLKIPEKETRNFKRWIEHPDVIAKVSTLIIKLDYYLTF